MKYLANLYFRPVEVLGSPEDESVLVYSITSFEENAVVDFSKPKSKSKNVQMFTSFDEAVKAQPKDTVMEVDGVHFDLAKEHEKRRNTANEVLRSAGFISVEEAVVKALGL